ncbi:zinc-finger-containing protein [Luteimonas marina]|uniref:zinc-finger-containing protein n=1 Tax=Luteimonas marina TaxID=488485 RepID=UPI0013157BFE|nr:zinc-finger-containing protein [Luteimonas marina]
MRLRRRRRPVRTRRERERAIPRVACPYCCRPAALLHSQSRGYPYPANWGPAWKCATCDACIRCYAGSERPLGSLANAETREWRRRAHAALDAFWRDGGMSRSAAYRWMAKAMGLTKAEAHIGRMDPEACRQLIELIGRRER